MFYLKLYFRNFNRNAAQTDTSTLIIFANTADMDLLLASAKNIKLG